MKYFNRKTKAMRSKKPTRSLAFSEVLQDFMNNTLGKRFPVKITAENVEYDDTNLTAAEKTEVERFIKNNG